MGRQRTITCELKLKNIINLLYGLAPLSAVKERPILSVPVSGQDEVSYHSCKSEFLEAHFWPAIYPEYDQQLLQDIYGRPQNTTLLHSGGVAYQDRILQMTKSSFPELVARNRSILEKWDCSSFKSKISSYLDQVVEAEAGERNSRYKIDENVLTDYISYLNHLLTAISEDETGNYAEVLSWILVGCILRHRLCEIQYLFRISSAVIEDDAGLCRADSHTDEGEFARMIDKKRKSDETHGNIFHFRNEKMPCYGRTREYELLDAFLQSEGDVAWFAITGKSGVGKSKLLYHYLNLENRPAGKTKWKKVFFSSDVIWEILHCTEWQYPGDLLIVFDYAGEYPEEIGEWIVKLRSADLKHKIRIVLLERESVYTRDCAEPAWYLEFRGRHDRKRLIESTRFDSGSKEKTYRLDGIEYEESAEIITKYVENIEPGARLTEQQKKQIYNTAKKIDRSSEYPRPLILIFTVDAYWKRHKCRKWDFDELTSYIRDKIFEYWQNSIFKGNQNLYDDMRRLLLYASCIGKSDIESETDIHPYFEGARAAFLELPEERQEQILQVMNMNDQLPYLLYPLEPDLIGEKFILDCFLKLHKKGKLGPIVNDLLRKHAKNFGSCIARCITDYYDVSRYSSLFSFGMRDWDISVDSLTNEAALVWAQIQVCLIYLGGLEEGKACIAVIEQLCRQYPGNTSIKEEYAKGLYNLSFHKNDTWAAVCGDKLKNLEADSQLNERIALQYAKCLFNLITEQIFDNPSGARYKEYFQSLADLHRRYKENSRIALEYAKTLMICTVAKADDPECLLFPAMIEELRGKFSGEEDFGGVDLAVRAIMGNFPEMVQIPVISGE